MGHVMNRLVRIKTLLRLGLPSLWRVGVYRTAMRLGVHPVQRVSAEVPEGPFFGPVVRRDALPPANARWAGQVWWFDWYSVERADNPPDWFQSPFGGLRINSDQNWWKIPDFGGGDIKGVWELSRFSWLVPLATQAAHNDSGALATINQWLSSWVEDNPPYRGPNWKCGQEASLRVIHILAAAIVLGQTEQPHEGLVSLIKIHLKRIEPTLSYAIGQDNNHGTSEAAALFCGGSYLASLGDEEGGQWARKGRHWLENRAAHLIAQDGSFSQYSTVYHRLMLDTYCFVEAWRRRVNQAPFSDVLYARLASATNWLDAVVDRVSGDAVNFGSNDGARILQFADTDYREFRPTLQTASVLFSGTRAIPGPGLWDTTLRWLGIPLPTEVSSISRSFCFDDGGLHALKVGGASAYLRYPRFRFRPSQSDLLHFDLWVDGCNLLRDAGSFSYNASEADGRYFPGTAAHNTIEFDGRDQMPRVSRFLFGEWPRAQDVTFQHGGETVHCTAAYTDRFGVYHRREVTLKANKFVCRDRVEGKFDAAILRWRLPPEECYLNSNELHSDKLKLKIDCNDVGSSIELNVGEESLYYMKKMVTPVLELKFNKPCDIVTIGEF